MELIFKPRKSKYQVGEIVFFLNIVRGESGQITKVQSSVSNPMNNNEGIQENIYYLNGTNKAFKEEELFHSLNAMMFKIKGDYLMKFGETEQIVLNSTDQLASCDFSFSLISSEVFPTTFNGVYLENSKFDGSDLTNTDFTGSDLYGCSFRFAKLNNVNLASADISQADFRGAILTGCTIPLTASTKSSFKTTVGAGHWDPETTIWTDGNPIG